MTDAGRGGGRNAARRKHPARVVNRALAIDGGASGSPATAVADPQSGAKPARAAILAVMLVALGLLVPTSSPVIGDSSPAGGNVARITGGGGSIGPAQEVPMRSSTARSMSSLAARTLAATTVAGAIMGGAADVRAQAVQWRVEDGGNGHWYEYVATRIPWPQAEASCVSRGGHLVSLLSAAENAFVNTIVSSRYLAGGFQPSSACEPACDWRWSSGEPWGYTNWNPGEPNNAGNEDYLLINPGFPGWNDITTESIEYVVEWSADCNNDGIVDYGQIHAGTLIDTNGNNVPDCCEQGVNCNQAEPGVEAHYTFEGNCLDSSGNGRNGAATSVGYVAGPAGLAGSAVSFDGVSSFVQIQGVPIPTNNAFSWSLWMRSDAIGPIAVIERIEAIGNNLMSPSLWIRTNGALGFGSYSFATGGTSVETAANTVTPGTWIHVACTSATSGVRRVYVNGSLQGENISADYGQPLAMFLVGRDRGDCCNPYFKGAIDDLRIYNRPLSASEVATLYAAGTACVGDILVDRIVNGADLGALLSYWGPVTSSPVSQACDLNRDNAVDGFDLALLLGNWGPCGN